MDHWIEVTGRAIDAAGVAVIVLGILLGLGRFVLRLRSGDAAYVRFRHDLGKGILLGLEFLVAADIIRTVALTPTLENVSILGLIVVIRTFLSLALQVELEGQWPWHRAQRGVPRSL